MNVSVLLYVPVRSGSLDLMSCLKATSTLSLETVARARRLFATAAFTQIAAVLLLALFPLTTGIAVAYVLVSGACSGFGQQQFFQLWSAEAFPTLLRATALGLMFAIVRIALGGWSLFLPTFLEAGFHGVAWTLIAFLGASALIGLAYARGVSSRSVR